MAIPRVFLSSTCYDLGAIRDSLRSFIESVGFDPCLSDRGDVFYHPDLHTHDSCLSEIGNCHLFVLIIGGRFGGGYVADMSKSVVNAEFSAAKELNIPVFTFVKRDVLEDHRLFQRNKTNSILSQIEFPSIEKQDFAKCIFQFIDDVRLSRTNNGLFQFEYSRDIETVLKKQWAGMMFNFLQRRQLAEQYESQNKLLSSLTATTGQLEDLVKRLYRRADEAQADSVIQNVELKSKAEQFFRDLFRYFGLQGFSRTSLDVLLGLPSATTWYEWLASTPEFDVVLNVVEEDSGRRLDILSHEATNMVLYVQGTDLKPYERKTIAEFEELFTAFSRLDPKQKRDVLAPYVLSEAAGDTDPTPHKRKQPKLG
jgi:Domain of unknown function (DUF4062)